MAHAEENSFMCWKNASNMLSMHWLPLIIHYFDLCMGGAFEPSAYKGTCLSITSLSCIVMKFLLGRDQAMLKVVAAVGCLLFVDDSLADKAHSNEYREALSENQIYSSSRRPTRWREEIGERGGRSRADEPPPLAIPVRAGVPIAAILELLKEQQRVMLEMMEQ